MPRTVRSKVSIALRGQGTSDGMILAGLFDMLRYDGSRVRSWNHQQTATGQVFTLELETDRVPTIERYRSFGIHAEVVS